MSNTDANEIIQTIRLEVECAVDVILSAAEQSLKALASAREGAPVPVDVLEQRLSEILEACAFQDITGQRLTKLAASLNGHSCPVDAPASLLNGPALLGQGLDQAAADLLVDVFRK